jgi:hypothetical protein
MKKILATMLAVCGVLGVTTSAMAQTTPPPAGKTEHKMRQGAMERFLQTDEEVLAKLNITPDEQTKISAIQSDLNSKIKAQQDADKAAGKKDGADGADYRDIVRTYRKSLMAILTPAQKDNYKIELKKAMDKWRAAHPGAGKGV